MKQKITLTINSKTYADEVEPRLLLIHYLREVAGLTGPHIGCETSICGACTVMLDGMAVKSCTMFAVQADGRDDPDHRRPRRKTASSIRSRRPSGTSTRLQCGFCTPGMILTARQLLSDHPNPTEQEIRHGLDGNLCRCTGYQHIVNAVKAAAKAGGA